MPQIGIGGAERQLIVLIRHSSRKLMSHEVLYYSDSVDDEGYRLYREAGIDFTRVPRVKRRPLMFLQDLSRIIKEKNPDIVHCWLWSGNIWGRWAALAAGHRSILLAYRNSRPLYASLLRAQEWLSPKYLHYLGNSKAVQESLVRMIGVDPRRIRVVYNGVDLDRYRSSSPYPDLRRELSVRSDVRIVTTVGRLVPEKNHDMLLDIAECCYRRNLPVHFVIVGHGAEGERLRARLEHMPCVHDVTFLGLRVDVADILASSDVFLFTSLHEGFPNALLEAMASGLPAISTNFPCAHEFIDDGENGTIIPIGKAEYGADAIQSYLSQPELARCHGRNARRTIEERFAANVMVKRTYEYYCDILEQRA